MSRVAKCETHEQKIRNFNFWSRKESCCMMLGLPSFVSLDETIFNGKLKGILAYASYDYRSLTVSTTSDTVACICLYSVSLAMGCIKLISQTIVHNNDSFQISCTICQLNIRFKLRFNDDLVSLTACFNSRVKDLSLRCFSFRLL